LVSAHGALGCWACQCVAEEDWRHGIGRLPGPVKPAAKARILILDCRRVLPPEWWWRAWLGSLAWRPTRAICAKTTRSRTHIRLREASGVGAPRRSTSSGRRAVARFSAVTARRRSGDITNTPFRDRRSPSDEASQLWPVVARIRLDAWPRLGKTAILANGIPRRPSLRWMCIRTHALCGSAYKANVEVANRRFAGRSLLAKSLTACLWMHCTGLDLARHPEIKWRLRGKISWNCRSSRLSSCKHHRQVAHGELCSTPLAHSNRECEQVVEGRCESDGLRNLNWVYSKELSRLQDNRSHVANVSVSHKPYLRT